MGVSARVCGVSVSGFYEWRTRPPSERAIRHMWLELPLVGRTPRHPTGLNWARDSLLEAQVIIGDWRIGYNHNRPHSAHGDLTPSEFAQAWTINQQPQPA